MNKELGDLLNKIGEGFKEEIYRDSDTYALVDIGEAAKSVGLTNLIEKYSDIKAIIPLRKELGVQFQVDGSRIINHVILDSGIIVNKFVADEAGISGSPYYPHKKMYLCLG